MKKFALVLLALVVLLFVGIGIAVLTFDPNKYKPDIVTALSKQTGRTVKLDGPISLHISLQGLTFGVQNASIGNASWASKPVMASIHEFDLGVGILPLLHHQVQVQGIKILNATIDLESSPKGEDNWDLANKTEQPAAIQKSQEKSGTATQPATGAPISIDVASVLIQDSHISIRDKEGKTSAFEVNKLTLKHAGDGFQLDLESVVNGTNVDASVKLGMKDLMTSKKFPIDATVTYAAYKLSFEGNTDLDSKQAILSKYKLSVGATDITGDLTAKWGGAKPAVSGSVNSVKLNSNDLKPSTESDASTKNNASVSAPAPTRAFSTNTLPLDGLKAADGHFKVKFDEVVSDKMVIKNVAGTIDLAGGRLNVDFPAMQMAGSTVDFKAVLDAATIPAHLEVSFAAPGIETAELMPMIGMGGFVSTKADAAMAITSSGNSLHDLASHATGNLSVISAGGKVLTDKLDPVIVNLLTAGSSGNSVGLNCLAVRFKLQDGVMADNGVLADTTVTTVLVKGNVNLGAETNDILLYAKPRAGGNIGSFIPPVHVGGTLLHPGYGVQAANIISNVAASLLSGGKVTGGTSPVPTVVSQSGQNACVYTLEHPAVAPAATKATPSGGLDLNQKPKDLGKALLKNFLGQ